jgi:hypothetical protein
MMKKTFTRIVLLLIIGLGYAVSDGNAQDLSPWTDNPYGNEWIDYSKKYVRVGVPKDGVYKILLTDLPDDLRVPDRLQLWYRGKEVAISVNTSEMTFYAKKNDGAGEGLLYRPGPEARLNPHQNILSELGYYFITLSHSAGTAKRITVVDGGATVGVPETYHMQTDVVTYTDMFSFATYGFDKALNHSYYTADNSWTSSFIFGPSVNVTPIYKDVNIKLRNWVPLNNFPPKIELLVNGLSTGRHQVNVTMGASPDKREFNRIFEFDSYYGFAGKKGVKELSYLDHLSLVGEGYMRIRTQTNDSDDYIGLSYFSITYPQLLDMGGSTTLSSAVFNFPSTGPGSRFVKIKNAPTNALTYDITDAYNPKFLNTTRSEADVELNVQRVDNNAFKLMLLAPNQVTRILPTGISEVRFRAEYANNNGDLSTPNIINPGSYEYIIISHDINKSTGLKYKAYMDSAIEYAKYRSKPEGGNYKTIVVNIRDIYDQFNFGEPSPIAINRFMKYMLKDGVKPKHNLFLIGHSITHYAKLKKEMPGEVPTFGDPSSDLLLVSGLQNVPNWDIPAIPVGRLNAYTDIEINNYLAKVQIYEAETNTAWRRNIVQLVGGNNSGEVSTFSGYFNFVNTNYVSKLLPRNVHPIKNNGGSMSSVNVDSETINWINDGVGMISYFGHGNQVTTSLALGEIFKTTGTVYAKNSKFPLLYFLGCGVGNNSYDAAKQYFAANWLMAAPDRGAIAVLANTSLTWVPEAKDHLEKLHEEIFTVTDGERETIGQIMRQVAIKTISPGSTSGKVMAATAVATTMIHQMSLMGDPAIKVLGSNDGSLPVELLSFKAQVFESKHVKLDWKTAWERNNSHFVIERSYNAKTFVQIGQVEGKNDSDEESVYSFIDTNPGGGINYYRLRSVDFTDGGLDKSYSKVISVDMPGSDQLVVYPNPIKDEFDISLSVPATFVSWKLLDLDGTTKREGKSLKSSLDNLNTGTYILEIYSAEGDVFRKKVVKR